MESLSGSFSLVDEFNEYFFDLEKDFYDYLNEIKYDYEKCSLCSALINYRRNKANELKSKEYMVFTNDTLIAIVENKPKTKEELLNTYGFSNKRYCKFGNDIIKIVLNN